MDLSLSSLTPSSLARNASIISFGVDLLDTLIPFSFAILRKLYVIMAGTPPASTESNKLSASLVSTPVGYVALIGS